MPLDHGYALYGAISRLLEGPGKPWLHESHEVGIHAIRGRFAGRGVLALTSRSELVIRAPEDWIDRFLPLAGQGVEIEGHAIELGFPVTRGLVPTTALYAHRVTTRNGQDEARFDAEIARRLSEEGIRGRPVRGPRRVFRVRDKRVVAHALLISELDANESLWLQERGLGGRRKLGCGVFLPWTP
ncbi:MAG: type I-MYXAN CRISPR-associated protein Cas6/Cmx6 [Gammaproteobacteria bacterium]